MRNDRQPIAGTASSEPMMRLLLSLIGLAGRSGVYVRARLLAGRVDVDPAKGRR